MAEPRGVLSYEDLILRVAKEAAIAYYGSTGNERAMIPVDAHDLDLCKQIVDDGIRMFISDGPAKGWRWMRRIMSVVLTATRITGTADAADATSITDATLETNYDTDDDLNDYWIYILTGTGAGSYAQIDNYTASGGVVSVLDWLDAYGNAGGTNPAADSTFAITPVETVGGDIARYPLAENFGGEVNGKISYTKDTNHGGRIEWCDESYLRARRSVQVQTGYPNVAAIKPLEFYSGGAGPKRRFELILDPQPVAADTLEFPYTLHFDGLRLEAGLATTGGATYVANSDLANLYPSNYFIGWTIKIISGDGKNATGIITQYEKADAKFNVADWLYTDGTVAATDPGVGSAYVLTPPANLHPAGFRFDEAIKAACLAQTEKDVEEVQAPRLQEYLKKALPQAHLIDMRSAPRKLGNMNNYGHTAQERTWTDVEYE